MKKKNNKITKIINKNITNLKKLKNKLNKDNYLTEIIFNNDLNIILENKRNFVLKLIKEDFFFLIYVNNPEKFIEIKYDLLNALEKLYIYKKDFVGSEYFNEFPKFEEYFYQDTDLKILLILCIKIHNELYNPLESKTLDSPFSNL
jgi:hypothetical protein